MSGLDAAAGIAGLISLSVTLFRGCVQGFELVSAANHIGNDADRVRSMLDWEQCRLLQWGQRVGLDQARQNRTLNWGLITDFLRQLEGLLSDAKVLRERYSLTFIDADASGSISRASTAVNSVTERKGIGRLWLYVKPELRSTRARIISENTGPLRKLQWAALDQDKIRRLIGDISYFNNCLHDLLDSAEQDFVRDTLSALLRDLVSRTTVSSDLDIIKALLDTSYIAESSSIEAAASLKQIRMLLGVDKRSDEKIPMRTRFNTNDTTGSSGSSVAPAKQTLNKLSYQALVRNTSRNTMSTRELATYKSSRKNINARVLLEWKAVEKTIEERLKRRIEGLTLMMSNTADPSFHSLRCLGYLRHETDGNTNMYAYVYEVVNLDEGESSKSSPAVRTLLSLFDEKRIPSLTYRIRLALALAQTVLQLHTSGWLHKGLRSENILFIERGDSTWANGAELTPYVGGYDFARADNPLEMTEDTPSSPEMDLYRHPQAQGVARPSFKKIYDLYALGCVLLEIACWSSLQNYLLFHAENATEPSVQPSSTANANEQAHLKWVAILRGKERLLDKEKCKGILEQVAFHAGDKYRTVVEHCFRAGESYTEDDETSVNSQINIVKLLERQTC
ncbi:hypothetical protein MMC34_005270 [Xylographa carneopallida]|nr:hypothetical protein [Xylographa carneopallida]